MFNGLGGCLFVVIIIMIIIISIVFTTILTNDIVSHEFQHFVYIDFFDNIPKTFDNVLNALLTDSLKQKKTENKMELAKNGFDRYAIVHWILGKWYVCACFFFFFPYLITETLNTRCTIG